MKHWLGCLVIEKSTQHKNPQFRFGDLVLLMIEWRRLKHLNFDLFKLSGFVLQTGILHKSKFEKNCKAADYDVLIRRKIPLRVLKSRLKWRSLQLSWYATCCQCIERRQGVFANYLQEAKTSCSWLCRLR